MALDCKRRDEQGRPILDGALIRLTRELVRANPQRLGHVIAEQILFVAGAARLASRASIRPFAAQERTAEATRRPSVTIDGVRILYEICLRPRFFIATTAKERIEIVAHELWHISPRFDGTLAADRRHRGTGAIAMEDAVRAIVLDWSAGRPKGSGAEALAFVGEVRLSAWLERPPSRIPDQARVRTSYDERDLHASIVAQR